MTTLANITNSAVNAGKRMLAAFTIDPIRTGFNEYELKMGSIQTIVASTGESLDVVNQKLDALNTYSDKTIYSFSDMTQNIGKFTNAGVKLDDAVAAIQAWPTWRRLRSQCQRGLPGHVQFWPGVIRWLCQADRLEVH